MKKVLLRAAAVVFAAMLALTFAPFFHSTAKADDTQSDDGNFIYVEDDSGGYDIVGYEGSDTDVTIPDTYNGESIVAIAAQAFDPDNPVYESNRDITSITFPTRSTEDLADYGPIAVYDAAFENLPSLASVDFANSGELEGYYIFSEDTSLASFACAADSQYLAVTDGVLFIRDDTTHSPTTLAAYPPAKGGTEYTVPNEVEQLMGDCFSGCTSLQSITLPDSLQNGSIGSSIFLECTNLAEVNASASSANFSSVDGVLFSKDGTTLIVYPPAKDGAYTIPSGVTALSLGSFDLAAKLTSVAIPAGLTDLENDPYGSYPVNPFAYSPQLSSITLDSSNTAYKMVDGVLFSADGATLIAYPPGRTATDPSIYAVKKPAAPQQKDSSANKAAKANPVIADAMTRQQISDLKAAHNAKPQAQARNTASVVKNGKNMSGNYIVPDDVKIIASGAFMNTTLAVVTFGPGSICYPADDNDTTRYIAPLAFPTDGSVSISAATDSDCTPYLKQYAMDNGGIPFIELNMSVDDNFYYTYDDSDNAIITAYIGSGTDVTIPDTITDDFGTHAVVEIGDSAFEGTDITHVAIPTGVTALDDAAFSECQELYGTLKLPDTITSIGEGCFTDCWQLRNVILPANLQTLGDGAFSFCSFLQDLTLPDGLKTIGSYCFNYCDIESIVIPDSVTSIGGGCFAGCQSLKSVTLPSGIDKLGDETFYFCKSLESISIPDGVTSIGIWCFMDCDTLTSVSIPKNVASIGDMAFTDCDGLKQFTVEAGNADFYATDGVLFAANGPTLLVYPIRKADTTYSIPSGTVAVATAAFDGDCPVQTVNIPASLATVGRDAFFSRNLRSLVVAGGTNLANLNGDGVLYNYAHTAILAYPKARPDATYNIPSTVKSLDDMSFYECKYLQTVNIHAGVTNMGSGTFSGCSSLLNINVASGNKTYVSRGGVVFGNTKNTKATLLAFPYGRTGTYTVPSGITTIGDEAFYEASLNAIYFPASVTTFGELACATNPDLEIAAFYGKPFKETSDSLLAFGGCPVTIYYHVSMTRYWSHFENDKPYYDSSAFIMLTLNYQGSQPNTTVLAPVYDNGTIDQPYDPAPYDGCTFAGWYSDAACKHAWDFDSNTVKNNITLYAYWFPDAPPSVDVEPVNYNTIQVSWSAVPHASGYLIERYSAPGSYKAIATVKGSVTSYANKNVTTGTTYYYRVTAFVQAGKNKFYGDSSSPLSTATALDKPVILTATQVNYTSAKVSWKKVAGATKYLVYRSADVDPLNFVLIKTAKSTSTSYTDSGALLGKYYYKIVAVRGGASSESDYEDVTTQLSAPVSLKYVKTATGYTLSWKAVDGATGYVVLIDGSPVPVTITKTSYLLTGLTAGNTYSITVEAYRTLPDTSKVYSDESNPPVTIAP